MEQVVFGLVVDGLDVDDDDSVDRLLECAGVVTVACVDGQVTVHLAIEASTSEDAVRAGLRLIEGSVPGAVVRSIDLDRRWRISRPTAIFAALRRCDPGPRPPTIRRLT